MQLHDTTQFTPNTIKRFWDKVDKRGPDDCWEWQGSIKNGYGQLRIGSTRDGTRRIVRAHRFSYEIHHGPIPDGLHCLHSCDRKRCTNPNHLFLGTHQDNMQDMARKKRGTVEPTWLYKCGEQNTGARLTAVEVRAIRKLWSEGMEQKKVARRYDVNQSTISLIVRHKTWKHLK